MLNSYLSLGIAVLFTSLGQLTFKKFMNTRKKHYLALTLFFFCTVPLFSYFALKKLALDIVYVSTAINVTIVSILSYFHLREPFDKGKMTGIFYDNCRCRYVQFNLKPTLRKKI